jgi:hypothetical protein
VKEFYESAVCVFFIGFFIFICFLCGVHLGKNSIKKEAVEYNHAAWVVSVDGKTTFKWKEAKP